jgi:5-(aminomethyl)-3-furanmethanol phosphate kinase
VTIDTVIKCGGSLTRTATLFARAVDVLDSLPDTPPTLIVPGGGAFADAVRESERTLAFGAEAAHWMAVLAMDQVAHLLAGRLRRARVVTSREEIERALAEGWRPVVAPYAWLRAADAAPGALPHSWDVTGDSIAAWIAGRVGARRVILLKASAPPGTTLESLVDPYFARALPAAVAAVPMTVDELARMCAPARGDDGAG